MEQERRTSGGQRVPFEALVVVANQKGGGAYECEAVDLSETGMHLRTAYLPEQGQRLTFRFDTGAGEVTLEGEVAWCSEEARGGEFGVRFARIDETTLAAIRETLGLSPENEPQPAEQRASRGARVRLHIDGLNSPMRARVRDDHTGAILVGSNLDFLKVGKPLELEDVERGKRRGALVDKVEVEVDPNSKIPQLVVTLRYEDAAQGAEVPRGEPGIKATADSKRSRVEDEPTRNGKEQDLKAEGEAAEGEAAAAGPGLKETLAHAGAKISAMSAPAREAVGKFLERLKARREQEVGKEDEKTPARRVTAPPPDGGIQTSGRRKQRSATEDPVEQSNPSSDEEINGLEESDEETLKVRKKQRVLIAAGASLLAVLLVVFGLRARSAAPPGAEASAAGAEANAVAANNALPAAPGVGSADVVSANVPLFGTTPLTTTEPAPLPAPAASVAANNGAGDAPGDEEDKGEEGAGKTEFGQGDVKKPRTVRIKMDAPITNIKGSASDDAITLFLPGRRNIEPAAPLSKRDKRISSVKAVPRDGGVEVTVAFKDSIPPFLAKANGKMLEIDLGQPSKGDGDEDGGTASARKSSKKKVAKGSKAADKKKASAKKAKKAKGKKAKKNSDD